MTSHPSNETSNVQENPPPTDPGKRKPSLPSRMIEKAAREQLAGPFGKLGRYALKQHWGMTISDWQEDVPKRAGERERKPAKKKGLFKRLYYFLKRPFQ